MSFRYLFGMKTKKTTLLQKLTEFDSFVFSNAAMMDDNGYTEGEYKDSERIKELWGRYEDMLEDIREEIKKL